MIGTAAAEQAAAGFSADLFPMSCVFAFTRYARCSVRLGTLALVCATGLAKAQPSDGAAPALEMAGAVREAVRTHPGVRNAEQLRLQAGEGITAARAGYLPQLKMGVDSQNTNYPDSSYEDARNVYTAKLTVSQMLYDFGKVRNAVVKAKAGVQAGEAQVQLSTDEVANATAQAWVEAHLQQALVQIAGEQLDGVTHLAAQVAERATKGATTRSDVEQANSRVEAARAQLEGAQADRLRASLDLMHLTGRDTPVAIAGEPPAWLIRYACHEGSGGANSPSVRLADARRDQARAELGAARAERLPTLSLDGTFGHALNDSSRLYGEYQNTSSIGLNFSVSLYDGGGMLARERAARYQLNAANDAAEQARLEMRQGFADALAQADGWARRAPVLQERVRSIHTTRDLYRQQYLQMGTRSLLDLLNAEQEYHNARIEQAQGLHQQYRLAVLCLYYDDRLRSAFGLNAMAEMNAGESQ